MGKAWEQDKETESSGHNKEMAGYNNTIDMFHCSNEGCVCFSSLTCVLRAVLWRECGRLAPHHSGSHRQTPPCWGGSTHSWSPPQENESQTAKRNRLIMEL